MSTGQYTTNDLSFAAYAMMRGCKLLSAKQLGRSYNFVLDLGDMQQQSLKIEYVNSEAAKFDAYVRDLKKILFSGG